MQNLFIKILKLVITLLVPVCIVGGAVSILTSDAFVGLEYRRAGFPTDAYGFTGERRFELASTDIHYVRGHLPADTLSHKLIDGQQAYNSREVAHMADVRGAFGIVFSSWHVALFTLVLLALLLWLRGETEALASALAMGGWVTAGLVLAVAGLVLLAWQVWFELLHRVFFAAGSWLFSYSDTLIRLFPEEFWKDASLGVAVLSLIGGVLLAFLGRRGTRQPELQVTTPPAN